MKKKKFKINQIFFLFLASFFYFNSCLIEIPIKPLKVKEISKYGNIKIKEPKDYSIKDNMNKTIFINEGKSILHPRLLFVTNIKIGSNNQEFNLILDTGSDILWVPKLGSNDIYKLNHHYNPSDSETSNFTDLPFDKKYGTASCSGYYYTDNIKYINNKNFKLMFGVAEKTNLKIDDVDGIIGLGYNYGDDEEDYSFIHMLKKHKITDSLAFSIKFEKDIYSGMSGKLIVGRHKDFSSSSVIACPLNDIFFWGCRADSIGIQDSKNKIDTEAKFTIIFDTGTNIIIFPLSEFKEIETNVTDFGCNLKYISAKSYSQLECPYNKRVDIRITINGNVIIVPKELIFYEVEENLYYSKVVFSDNYLYYIMGNPFFLAYHTLFDEENKQLLFYPLKNKYKTKDENEDDDGLGTFSIICIILAVIIFLIILGYITYRIILWLKSKRDLEEEIASSNYLEYNVNYDEEKNKL